VPHAVLAVGIAGLAASGQSGEGGVGEPAAGELTVDVVAAQQQRTEPVGLRGRDRGQLAAGAEQDPQGFAVTVGAWGR
jgi:hypothetical protein